ncbi:SpaA isopeptide-forming pilin-related protein [uncultured Helcococcus sp.]|uniref:SpaA isopeptide-forming pilin-related protein n=1 Tax=uncultured Helcococcus sp. TaxID=1072508 RepID=UPI00261E8D2B|nr:SpaA isopeptide-forming pilin-related protein [uncultured Helcococcus sp.]
MKNRISILLLALLFLIPTNILAANNGSSELYEITIQSLDKNGQGLKGFKYKIVNKNTKEETIVDLTDSTSKVVKLKKGEYHFEEIQTLKGYEKSKRFDFKIPLEGTGTIQPKHLKTVHETIVETERETEKETRKETDKETGKETDKETGKETGKETSKEPKGKNKYTKTGMEDNNDNNNVFLYFLAFALISLTGILVFTKKKDEVK